MPLSTVAELTLGAIAGALAGTLVSLCLHPVDTVKIASGRFPLRIATRATFLGVKVQNSNNTLSEVRDANGNQAVEAFDLSYSGMRAIFEKLKPKVPYMYNGQALFNDAYQFITPNQTFAISLEFANDNKGPGTCVA